MITEENYYEDRTHITNSGLSYLKKSPMHFYHYLTGEKGPSSAALEFGSAYHVAVLEPDTFDDVYAIKPKGLRRGTVAHNNFQNDNVGKLLVSTPDWDKIQRMRDVLYASSGFRDLIDSTKKESIKTWEKDGIKCKGKFDGDSDTLIFDLKSTGDAGLAAFGESSLKWGYDRQAAYYIDGKKAADKKDVPFLFVPQEKEYPYVFGIYETSEDFVSQGRKKYLDLLSEYKRLFIEKSFNGQEARGTL